MPFCVLLQQRMSGTNCYDFNPFLVNSVKVSDWGRHKRNCKPVMIKDMGIKGRGLVASKAFVKGDLILKDKVVVSYKADCFFSHSRRQLEELMEQVDNLEVDDRRDYFNLEKNLLDMKRIPESLFEPSEKEYIDAWCIYTNNRIRGHVCLTLSLLNHSCDPNSIWSR